MLAGIVKTEGKDRYQGKWNGDTCGAFEQIFSRLTLLGGAKSLLVEKLPDLLIGRELEDSLIV